LTVSTPTPQDANLLRIVTAIRQLASGRSNATGVVTLTASAASTTVTHVNCSEASAVFLFPQTSNAAAALATTYVQSGSVANGAFTITHANAVSTDRTFWFLCIG
jgi:hypothetical protein